MLQKGNVEPHDEDSVGSNPTGSGVFIFLFPLVTLALVRLFPNFEICSPGKLDAKVSSVQECCFIASVEKTIAGTKTQSKVEHANH